MRGCCLVYVLLTAAVAVVFAAGNIVAQCIDRVGAALEIINGVS